MLKTLKKFCASFVLIAALMLATTFNSSAQEDFPIGDGCFSGDTLIGIYHYDTDDGYTIQYVICRSALSGIYVVAIDVY